MNPVWAQFKSTSEQVGRWTTRKQMRDLLRSDAELTQVRKRLFGAWRFR